MEHLILYDGECGLCTRSVRWLLSVDQQTLFCFAPLQGKTAASFQKKLPKTDTIVLVENFQGKEPRLFFFGQAFFRICWLLGGKWRLIGWLAFVPPFLYNFGYRLVARYRHHFFKKGPCPLKTNNEKRFLD